MGGVSDLVLTGQNIKNPITGTNIIPNIPMFDLRNPTSPDNFIKRATHPDQQFKADMNDPNYKYIMGNKNVMAAKDRSKSILQQTGQALFDVGTLGQSYSARQAKKSQQEMIAEMRQQQAAQEEALRKQGPAPTMTSPTDREIFNSKRHRLESLRAGLASTIKTGKTKLGA